MQQARLGGEIQTLANDEKDKKEELETEYRGIDDRYRKELINLKARRLALRYSRNARLTWQGSSYADGRDVEPGP